MVRAVRAGVTCRAVARRYRVSLCTVQRWVHRAGDQPLHRIDWDARSHATTQPGRATDTLEGLVLSLRQELRTVSALGDYGADAIRATLLERGTPDVPCARTIHRILERRGALDRTRRLRRPPPPPGWYLPDVARAHVELDSFVEIFNGISLHGGLIESWPGPLYTAARALERVLAHWRAVGLPTYAQFDNDTRFQGPHHHRDVISRIMRLCLSLGVTPVFAPPREHGFQNAVESLNGRWQVKVWNRFHHETLAALHACSDRFVAATRVRRAARIAAAPTRAPIPPTWQLDLQAPPTGRVVFLRRTDAHGAVAVLGHPFALDPLWPHRLVRCEVELASNCVRFYRLRRRQPDDQPLICEHPYILPLRRFRGRT
jgi:hypothetical protein